MVALSFLVVVAVASSDDAPFDAALAAEGARGLAAARTARDAVLSGPRHVETREALIVEVLHPQLCGNGPVCRARMRAADWANR